MVQPKASTTNNQEHLAHQIANEMVLALCEKLEGFRTSTSDQSVEPKILKLVTDLRGAVEPLTDILKSSLENYARTQVPKFARNIRSTTLERILVQPIEHLFAKQSDDVEPRLSRRLLPGLFRSLNMMLGENTLSEYRERAQQTASELSELYGPDFGWDFLYNDPNAKKLLLDALVGMTGAFSNFPHRVSWLVDIINSTIHQSARSNDRTASWQIGEAGCLMLLREMFEPLRKIINNAHLSRNFALSYDEEDVARVRIFIAQLYSPELERLLLK